MKKKQILGLALQEGLIRSVIANELFFWTMSALLSLMPLKSSLVGRVGAVMLSGLGLMQGAETTEAQSGKGSPPIITTSSSVRTAVGDLGFEHHPRSKSGWDKIESENFEITHKIFGKDAEDILGRAEQERADLHRTLMGKEHEAWRPKCMVKLYPTGESFEKETRGHRSQGGFAYVDRDPSSDRIVERKIDLLHAQGLRHEIAHVVVEDWSVRKPPTWFNEGVACGSESPDSLEERFGPIFRSRIEDLFHFDDLFHMKQHPQKKGDMFYAQSAWLVAKWGPKTAYNVADVGFRKGYNAAVNSVLEMEGGVNALDTVEKDYIVKVKKNRKNRQPDFPFPRVNPMNPFLVRPPQVFESFSFPRQK